MNKYLLLTAAGAMAATSGVAQASTTVHLNSYCDYFVISNTGGGLLAAKHMGALSCSSATYDVDAGIGPLKGKNPVSPKSKKGVDVFGDVILDRVGYSNNATAWGFSTPFSTTGTWVIVYTTNGSTAAVLNSGNQSKHQGMKSGKSAISDFIKAMRK